MNNSTLVDTKVDYSNPNTTTNNVNATNTHAVLPIDMYIDPEVQTYNEEIFNSLSHGLGLVLCIPAVFFLLSLARMKGSKWHVFSCSIYGISLMTMYFCSTLYHSVDIFHLTKYRSFFKDLDHCAIYMLIAGTYTPLTLINLVYNNLQKEITAVTNSAANFINSSNNYSSSNNGEMLNSASPLGKKQQKKKTPKVVKIGWTMFILVWIMCALGVGSKLVLGANGVPDILSNCFYLLMGWISVIGLKDLIKNLPKKGTKLLLSGGITYTGGIGMLLWETQPFNHAIWHLFVTAGSLFHYFCILESLLPSSKLKVDSEQVNHSVTLNVGSEISTTTTIKATTTTTTTIVNNKHHSIILEHLEYAEQQIKMKFFGSGRRKNFIISYMKSLHSVFLGWYSKEKLH